MHKLNTKKKCLMKKSNLKWGLKKEKWKKLGDTRRDRPKERSM